MSIFRKMRYSKKHPHMWRLHSPTIRLSALLNLHRSFIFFCILLKITNVKIFFLNSKRKSLFSSFKHKTDRSLKNTHKLCWNAKNSKRNNMLQKMAKTNEEKKSLKRKRNSCLCLLDNEISLKSV
jgi:hypothetical protein